MNVNYDVHSCSEQAFDVEVMLGDQKVKAAVPGLVVELVSSDGTMSHTLKFVPEDMAAARTEFAAGNHIVATFGEPAPAEEAPAEEPAAAPAE